MNISYTLKLLGVLCFFGLLFTCRLRSDQTSKVTDSSILPKHDRSYTAFGVEPDCNETEVKYEDLVTMIDGLPKDPKVDRQQEFLNRIPKKGMQTFVLMYHSESAQQPGVNSEFPGVVRMTQDGKLVIRYTCNRNVKETYGRVEVMRFDDKDSKFKFSEFDLRHESIAHKVHENPGACLSCHNVSDKSEDPRPNWTSYPDWPGTFGSHDDFFPSGVKSETEHVKHGKDWLPPNKSEEREMFEKFMQAKVYPKDPKTADPCYTTLPWLNVEKEKIPEKYANYPYDIKNGHAKDRIYALRPNLKFTEILSKLLAKRNFRKLKDHSSYHDLQKLLVLEAASCTESSLKFNETNSGSPVITKGELDAKIKKILPLYERPIASSAKSVSVRGIDFFHHDPRHPSSRAQALYGVWRGLGFEGGEWTLVPFEYSEPQFETGGGPGANTEFPADVPVTAYVQTEILDHYLGDSSNKPYVRASGEADDFGSHFSCIDKLAAPKVFKSQKDWKSFCSTVLDSLSTSSVKPASDEAVVGGTEERKMPMRYKRDMPFENFIQTLPKD